jgi:hypothetical protein
LPPLLGLFGNLKKIQYPHLQFYRVTIELMRRAFLPKVLDMTLSGKGRKPVRVVGDSFRHQVANRIRTRRLELQMRAEDAAERVSRLIGKPVSVQTWYHWEKAEHPFDIDILPAIAKALQWEPQQLIGS